MIAEALCIPGIPPVTWQVRWSSSPAALELADRHYSRRSPRSACIGPPGRKLTLVSPCERAVWLTSYSAFPDDGLDAFRCSIFRNEGAGLSSELIVAAMVLTEAMWPDLAPRDGWVTWVKAATGSLPRILATASSAQGGGSTAGTRGGARFACCLT